MTWQHISLSVGLLIVLCVVLPLAVIAYFAGKYVPGMRVFPESWYPRKKP
jgi:hypothetical protein